MPKPLDLSGDFAYTRQDCLQLPLDDNSVDLVLGSPPYEAARTYDIGFNLKGDAWVEWAADRYMEHLRVCKGLVAWVVEGQVNRSEWSATPALLMAELRRRGAILRKPPIFHRVGICGGGGHIKQHLDQGGSADWLRNDWEFIVCATKTRGKLPWADTLWEKRPPKYSTGGAMSNRTAEGRRVNKRKNHRSLRAPNGKRNGDVAPNSRRPFPKYVNPGNVIKCKVGGGHIGSKLAHENEAPYPEQLAEFFVRSFCPLGGVVLDPFSGSGTTAAVAIRHGRRAVACDIRQSQIRLTRERVAEVYAELGVADA
ncbi:MAG: site-specific DNA-methyltransferase [Planctomycetota bacterium]